MTDTEHLRLHKLTCGHTLIFRAGTGPVKGSFVTCYRCPAPYNAPPNTGSIVMDITRPDAWYMECRECGLVRRLKTGQSTILAGQRHRDRKRHATRVWFGQHDQDPLPAWTEPDTLLRDVTINREAPF